MLSEDMDDLLRDYFLWARINAPDNVGYPHQTPFRRLLGSGIGAEGITDEEAEDINQAMCAMMVEEAESYAVIKRLYGDRRSTRWMEKQGYGDRRTIMRLAAEGRKFLKGYFHGKRRAEDEAEKVVEPR